MEVCEQEEKALEYFAGQLSESEQIKVEAHIAECHKCCQMVANLTKTTFSEESKLSGKMLDKKIKLTEENSLYYTYKVRNNRLFKKTVNV